VREPTPAVSNSRSTASGVTMPLGCWRLTLHYRNGGVDIDRYIARNQATWARLAELTGRARRQVASLSPAELDELIQLYQRTSAHLSYARTHLREPTLISRLRSSVTVESVTPIPSWRSNTQRVPGRH